MAYRPLSTAVRPATLSAETHNTSPPSAVYHTLHPSFQEPLPVHTEDFLSSVAGHFSVRHQQPELQAPTPHTSILSSDATPSLPRSNSTGTDLADFAALLFIVLWYLKPAIGPSLFPTGIANASTRNILFQTVLRPASSFQNFCRNMLETTKLSLPAVFVALEFLNRLKDRCRGTTKFVDTSPAKLMTVMLMLADKFVTDNTFTVATWAQVTGIPAEQLVKLEFQVLDLLDYRIFISKEGYEDWIERLRRYTAEYNAARCRIICAVRAQQFRRRGAVSLAASAEENLPQNYRKKANAKVAKGNHVDRCISASLWKRQKTGLSPFKQQVVEDKILPLQHVSRACLRLPFISGAPLAPLSEDLWYPSKASIQTDVPMASVPNPVSEDISLEERHFSQTTCVPLVTSTPQGSLGAAYTRRRFEQDVGCSLPWTLPGLQNKTFPNTLPHASSEGAFSFGGGYGSDDCKRVPLTPTPSSLNSPPFYIPQPFHQQMHVPYIADRNRIYTLAV